MFRTLVVRSAKPSLLKAPRSLVFAAQTGPAMVRFYSEEAKKDEPKEEAKEEAKDEPTDELSQLKAQVESAKKETAEFKDRYLRSIADFRNLQESTKREIKKSKELALKAFAKDLLETADTFEIALKTLEQEDSEAITTERKVGEIKDLIEGVRLTQNLFVNTLRRHGLEKIEALGEKFDPNVHEATFEVPQADKEPGSVFFVQQPGYYLNKRVLRPAKVGVVKAAE